jgi:hypothetical protein
MDTAKALFQSTLTAPHHNIQNESLPCNGGAAPHQTGEGSNGQNTQRKRSRDGDVLGADVPQVLSCLSGLAAVAAAFLTWWPLTRQGKGPKRATTAHKLHTVHENIVYVPDGPDDGEQVASPCK